MTKRAKRKDAAPVPFPPHPRLKSTVAIQADLALTFLDIVVADAARLDQLNSKLASIEPKWRSPLRLMKLDDKQNARLAPMIRAIGPAEQSFESSRRRLQRVLEKLCELIATSGSRAWDVDERHFYAVAEALTPETVLAARVELNRLVNIAERNPLPEATVEDDRKTGAHFKAKYGLIPDTLKKAAKDGRLKRSEKRGGRWFHSESEVAEAFADSVVE